jgi:hypothetical protein
MKELVFVVQSVPAKASLSENNTITKIMHSFTSQTMGLVNHLSKILRKLSPYVVAESDVLCIFREKLMVTEMQSL